MTASSPNESFICRCGPGWEGKWCDIPMKYPCMVERCQNGGTCVAGKYSITIITHTSLTTLTFFCLNNAGH